MNIASPTVENANMTLAKYNTVAIPARYDYHDSVALLGTSKEMKKIEAYDIVSDMPFSGQPKTTDDCDGNQCYFLSISKQKTLQ